MKGAAKTLGKATLVSVLPEAFFMAIIYALGKYDDWEEFDDRSKDAYYLIPIGDGKAIKIAKGREWAQLIANPLMRAWQGLNGREDPFENYWDTSIAPNFIPSTPLDAIGISQAIDLLTNKDFAGRSIVPSELQGIEPQEQYDENTSFMAKAIGKALNLSPIQIDYVIGDYFGDFGDILIELTNGSNADAVDYVKDLFTSPFVADSAYSNRVNTEYYNLIDTLESEIATMKVKEGESYKDSDRYQIYQAINKFKNRISELNKEARESKDAEASRLLKLDARAIQQEALDFYDAYMNGEIEDPVRHLEYDPYGNAIRDELIRLKTYEGGDYTFLPSSSAPKIGDHKNTDAEKDSYKEIYEGHYTREIGSVISAEQYKSASDEKKLSMLEGARELAYFYAKQEWASMHGIKSDSYDPETVTNKYDTLIDTGLSYFDAYAIEETYKSIRDSKEYGSQTLRATAYAAWVDSHGDWTAEQKLAAKDAYKFTQTMIVDPKKYDAMSDLGLNAETSELIVSVVSGIKPNQGEETVSDLQKWQAIVSSDKLSDADKDKGLRAYMDADALSEYEPCYQAGVTASEYIGIMTSIDKLSPLPGKDSVTSSQKWELCVSTVSGDKKKDALIRRYMTDAQESKYDMCRDVEISPDIYVQYSAAKYTFGNGNGSWTQDELQEWLDSQKLTNKQKSVLWFITNSGWKKNPYS